MMHVQQYLRSGKTLDDLNAELGITAVIHPSDSRVIMNYSQLNSPKCHPIVKECRGLVLDRHDNWNVVARAFPRFYRYGEALEETSKFDWSTAKAWSKEDGSLILIYWYQGGWHINTRGSFGSGKLPYQDITWREACWRLFRNDRLHHLGEGNTLVFELCTLGNKVVRDYPKPKLFLLSVFDNEYGRESPADACNFVADLLRVSRPKSYPVGSAEELIAWLSGNDVEEDFEGVVLSDASKLRLKLKNPRYDALHHLWDNGSLASEANLLPFIMSSRGDYIISKFPMLGPTVERMSKKLEELKSGMMTAWHYAKNLPSQKDFALAIVKATPLTAVLFEARKRSTTPDLIFNEFAPLILKHLT